MTSSHHELNDAEWMLVEDVLHRLEEAWHSKTDPQIEDFTSGLEPSLLDPTVVECIKVDLEYRWRTMQPAFLESYFERWPHLADDSTRLLELLEAECATRAVFSMPATADELARRFPSVAGQIDLADVERHAERDRVCSAEEESVAEQASLTKPLPPRENAPPVYLPLTIGQTFGRYKIRGQVGEGGEGNVYRAYDRQMDRDVALKFPRYADADVFERFLHQSKVAAKLEHRNICRVYDAGTIGGVHFIAMALIRGATIQQTLEEHGPFDYEEAATLVRRIACALGRVHEADIIHRDIKSANIMIDPDGEPVLMDFGLARSIENSVGMTTTGAFAGTLAFMSPEVAAGESAEQRSDIYSLGVVFYHMLTGTVPFGISPAELLKHLGKSPAPSPHDERHDLPVELDQICRKAMAPKRDDRYPSADELADALQRFEEGRPQKYKPPRKPLPSWLWPAARGILVTLLLGLLLLRSSGCFREAPRSAAAPSSDEVAAAKSSATTTEDASDITIIEPAPRSVDRWINLSAHIAGIAITHDSKRAFVANYDVNSEDCVIHEIDLATGTERSVPITIQEFPGGFDLVLSADDRHLYAASYYSNSIACIDLGKERKVTKTQIIADHKMKDPVWWRWASCILLTPDNKRLVIPMGNDNWPDYEEDDGPALEHPERIKGSNDQISIVDVAADPPQLIHEIALEDEPTGSEFCLSQDGQFAYLTTRPRPTTGTPKLYEVQLQPPYRIRTSVFPANAELESVVLSEKLNRLYVCDRAHRKIWILDRSTLGDQTPTRFFHLNLRVPNNLAIDDRTETLVALSGDNRSLHFLDAFDGRILARVEGLRETCWKIELTPDGKSVLIYSSRPGDIGIVPIPEFNRKIAFSSNRGGGTFQIYTLDPSGENLQPLFAKQNYANDQNPRWAPDGQRLAFISGRNVKPRVCTVQPGNPKITVFEKSTPAPGRILDWSPTGEQIMYVDRNLRNLHLLDVATGELTRLDITFPGNYREFDNGCWASNGYIYATVMPIRNGTRSEVFRIDPVSLKVERLTDEPDKKASYREISVARSGRMALLWHKNTNGPADGLFLTHGNRSLEEDPVRITDSEAPVSWNSSFSWYPNGEKLVIPGTSHSDPYQHIFLFDPARNITEQLTTGDWTDNAPDVSVRLPDPPAR